jgi:carbon starvation protein
MMVACVIGIIVYRPGLNAPAFTGFMINGSPLFPTLFVTFACGACSGVHSLVGSGTTSKQVANESHMQVIAYFGMLLEGFLALVALTCFVFLTPTSELTSSARVRCTSSPMASAASCPPLVSPSLWLRPSAAWLCLLSL